MPSMLMPAAIVLAAALGFQPSEAGLTAKVTKITETRFVDLKPPAKGDGGFTFKVMMDNPGLKVTLAVPMAGKVKIIGVEQPKTIVAKDSVGTDLTDIEKNFDGEREFLEENKFGFNDDDPKAEAELVLNLSMPARKAESFSVSCESRVIVGGDAKDVPIAVSEKWTKLTAPEFASLNAMYRVKAEDTETTLEFKTADIKPLINKIAIVTDSGREESTGWMVMNGELSYTVPSKLEGDAKLVIETYIGVKTLPLKIDLKDVKLP